MSDLKILIVDDSATSRKVLTQAVSALAGVGSVVAAPNGPIAFSKMAIDPADLVLLDVFMPEMDGPEVLVRLRRDFPAASVVMVSGSTDQHAEITLKALAAGALDFIPKPQGTSMEEGMEKLRSQLRNVLQIVRMRVGSRNGGTITQPVAAPAPRAAAAPAPAPTLTPASTPPVRLSSPPIRPELLLIGVSTGGPRALQDLIPLLSASFRTPVVIVQHMPPVFTKSLAEHLDKASSLRVLEAGDGETLVAGHVYIAPGGRHLELVRAADGSFRTKLTDGPPVNSCRPSVDVLFRSAAACRLRGCVAVVLTGMGEDGAAGIADLKTAGPTWCLTQDAATCVVYGMPMAVAQRGLSDEVLPLPSIAPRLDNLFSR